MIVDFLTFIKKRKTTYEFSSKEVSDEAINYMLKAARWAPSCTNTQPWHFVVVKNEKRVDKLMETTNYGDFHTNPNVIIVAILRDDFCHQQGRCFRGVKESVYDSYISVGIATYNIVLAAQSRGISSCFLSPKVKDAAKIVKVKGKDKVVLMVGLGYEKKGAFKKERIRRPLKEIYSEEVM